MPRVFDNVCNEGVTGWRSVQHKRLSCAPSLALSERHAGERKLFLQRTALCHSLRKVLATIKHHASNEFPSQQSRKGSRHNFGEELRRPGERRFSQR